MKKLSLKLLSLLFALILILSVLIACDEEKKPSDDGESTASSFQDGEKNPLDELTEEEKAFYILSLEVDDSGKTSTVSNLSMVLDYMGMEIETNTTASRCQPILNPSITHNRRCLPTDKGLKYFYIPTPFSVEIPSPIMC